MSSFCSLVNKDVKYDGLEQGITFSLSKRANQANGKCVETFVTSVVSIEVEEVLVVVCTQAAISNAGAASYDRQPIACRFSFAAKASALETIRGTSSRLFAKRTSFGRKNAKEPLDKVSNPIQEAILFVYIKKVEYNDEDYINIKRQFGYVLNKSLADYCNE